MWGVSESAFKNTSHSKTIVVWFCKTCTETAYNYSNIVPRAKIVCFTKFWPIFFAKLEKKTEITKISKIYEE